MFGSSSKGFDATKLKATLRLANSRFDVAKNKKSALMKQNMREIALLLAEEPPKEEKARIRTERLIKDDFLIEAYEILQLECQLLTERVQLLKHCKTGECPPDLVGCVSDLIYAAPYVEIPELQEIRKQLVAKFGKQFAVDADQNKNGVVSARIAEKLSLAPPTAYMVENYMTKIAKLHEVKYEPTIRLTLEEACEPIAAPVGYSVPSSVVVTGLAAAEDKTSVSSGGSTPPTNPGIQKSLSPTVVQALAYPTAPTTPSAPTEEANTNDGVYDEPDIFVPTIPTAPRGFSSTNQDATIPTAPRGIPSMDNNDDHEDGDDDAIEITLDEHKEASSLSVVVEPATEEEEEENIAVNKSELYNAMTGLSSTPTVTVIKSEERDNRDTEEETIIARSHDFGSDAAATKKDIDKVTIEESQTPTSNLKEQQVMMKDESQSSLAALRARFQLLGNTPVVNDEKKKEDAKIKAEEEEEAKLNAAEEAKLKVEEELRLKAEEEAKLKAEEEARIQAEEEMRLRAEEEAKLKAEEEARLKAEQEAWRKAEEEAKRKAEEEAAEEARVMFRAQEEAERRAQEEAKEESQSESRHIDQETLDRTVAQSENQEGDLLAAPTPSCEVKNDPLVTSVDEKENMGTTAPKKKDDPDYTTGAALAGAAIGFATVGSVVGGLVGAAGVAHLAANEKGTAGDMARKCGKKVSKMTNKLVQKMHRA